MLAGMKMSQTWKLEKGAWLQGGDKFLVDHQLSCKQDASPT